MDNRWEGIESTEKIDIPLRCIWAWTLSVFCPESQQNESDKKRKRRIEEEAKYRKFVWKNFLIGAIDEWSKYPKSKNTSYDNLKESFPREIEATTTTSIIVIGVGTIKIEFFCYLPEKAHNDKKDEIRKEPIYPFFEGFTFLDPSKECYEFLDHIRKIKNKEFKTTDESLHHSWQFCQYFIYFSSI